MVFAPKYRREVFFEEKRAEIREILYQLCQWEKVEIIEGEACPDHIHILVSIPPKMSVSGSTYTCALKGREGTHDGYTLAPVTESNAPKQLTAAGYGESGNCRGGGSF